MGNFERIQHRVAAIIFCGIAGSIALSGSVALALIALLDFDPYASIGIGLLVGLGLGIGIARLIAHYTLEPLKVLEQAILHVDPNHASTPPPNLEQLQLGRELVTALALQVYQFASQQNTQDLMEHRTAIIQASSVVSHVPLALFVFNRQLLVTNASLAALDYCGTESSDLFGKPIFDSLNLEFRTEDTLESWIADCQNNKVTDSRLWERVRVRSKDGQLVRQCDMSAYYNRENPSGTDFIVTLFDRTEQYNQDDDSLSFVSLAVHELRTPLTMLRGYIEVFQEELGSQLNTELTDFMLKMQASANQLTAFVHNILNVARIEQNQLSLHLTEKPWKALLMQGLQDMELRAKIHGKTLEYNISDNLPTVGVDPVSMAEVLNNLVDNAIKYSPTTTRIIIQSSVNADGLVETTVQDFGVGIPQNVLPNLFTKFYRNHRTKGQIGGTGLGLYLSKAIITAHGGQIWATSKPGEGSTFGFTLVPYARLATELKQKNDVGIERQAHGWIKNHSLYRR